MGNMFLGNAFLGGVGHFYDTFNFRSRIGQVRDLNMPN